MTDVFNDLKPNIRRIEIVKDDIFIIEDPSNRLLEKVKLEYVDEVYKMAQNIALSVYKFKKKN